MQENNPTLAIIMPVYNEEAIVETVIKRWASVLEGLRINYAMHIYNDGSRDRTGEILSRLAAANSRIIVHDQENRGHGPTILSGYKNNSAAEWIFQSDSDNETDPADFIKLWEKRNEYDFLIGRRVSYPSSLIRRMISAVARAIIGLLYGRGIHDVNSPFRLIRNSSFKSIFESIPSNTASPNLIISGMAIRKKMRIFEAEIAYHFRTTGEVSIRRAKLCRVALSSFFQTIAFAFQRKK
jgi:Glycosyltransferases involved in cell wall biogenesis